MRAVWHIASALALCSIPAWAQFPPDARTDSPARSITRHLQRIEIQTGMERAYSIGQLALDLNYIASRRGPPDVEDRVRLTQAIFKILDGIHPGDPSREQTRMSSLELLLQFGSGARVREFVFAAFDSGTENERHRIRAYIGNPWSSISAEDRWNKVEAVYAAGGMSLAERIKTLKRIDEKRASSLNRLALVEASGREFERVARMYQGGGDPMLMRDLLAAASAQGRLDVVAVGSGRSWLDNQALASYLAVVPNDEVATAMKAAVIRPCHAKFCFRHISERNFLSHESPIVRKLTADYIRVFAGSSEIDLESSRSMLEARAEIETNSEVNSSIRSALDMIDYQYKKLHPR